MIANSQGRWKRFLIRRAERGSRGSTTRKEAAITERARTVLMRGSDCKEKSYRGLRGCKPQKESQIRVSRQKMGKVPVSKSQIRVWLRKSGLEVVHDPALLASVHQDRLCDYPDLSSNSKVRRHNIKAFPSGKMKNKFDKGEGRDEAKVKKDDKLEPAGAHSALTRKPLFEF